MLSKLVILIYCGSVFAATHIVKSGGSISKAVQKAKPGDTIEVRPGTYHESVVIDVPNIKLLGKVEKGAWPTLDGKNTLSDGVISAGDDFLVQNLKIKNYRGNGITTQGGNNITIRKLVVENTGIYGIYPTRATNVLVEENVVTGIADAGIYVGMCTYAEVKRNEAFKNVAGIEIENSSHVLVEENYTHDNAGGILAFTLPGLPVKDGSNTIIRRNLVEENNHENFAPKGAIVENVPSGSGIIVLAGKEVVIEDNFVRGNKAGGIFLADLTFVADSTKPDPQVNPRFENNKVLDNFFYDNGAAPGGRVKLLLGVLKFRLRGGDVVAHGDGKGNCAYRGNGADLILTKDFTDCPAGATSRSVKTVLKQHLPESQRPKFANLGEKVFGTICAGCHGMGVKLLGPAVEEIQAKYKGNPRGVSEYAFAPNRVRGGFMAMPPQAHLGKDRLAAAAEWLLNLKSNK